MKLTIAFVGMCLLLQVSAAQVRPRRSDLNRAVPPATQLSKAQKEEAAMIFDRVLESLESGAASDIPGLFHTTVHMALPGIEQGQFSRDQATQLFTSYSRAFHSTTYVVKKREDSLISPYLSASLSVRQGDATKELNLYVSLIQTGEGWRIGHFSLY